MKVSVVIPVYNEENRIEKTAETLDRYLKELVGEGEYEIIFSNDGSTDGTPEIAEKLCEKYPAVRAVGYEKNRGKGCAVRTGMLASEGDATIFTDCDLAYGTDVIGSALEKFGSEGADVVIGSRNLERDSYAGYTFMRKTMSKVYIKVVSIASGFKLSDSQCGFKGFKKNVAHDVFGECTVDGFAFDLEALIKAQNKGYRIAEMPVKILNHDEGASKVRVVKDTLKMLKDIRMIRKQNKKNA